MCKKVQIFALNKSKSLKAEKQSTQKVTPTPLLTLTSDWSPVCSFLSFSLNVCVCVEQVQEIQQKKKEKKMKRNVFVKKKTF